MLSSDCLGLGTADCGAGRPGSHGAKRLPSDHSIQDWGITYDEMEPYYARAERMLGISGKAGDLAQILSLVSCSFDSILELLTGPTVKTRLQAFDGAGLRN
jgi:choline dehydrogenase-like flavoprotein